MNGDGNVREVPFAEHARWRQELREEIAAVNWLLLHLRESLPPACATSLALGRNAPWQEILQLARWEGLEEIATLLEEAQQRLGTDLPQDTRVE